MELELPLVTLASSNQPHPHPPLHHHHHSIHHASGFYPLPFPLCGRAGQGGAGPCTLRHECVSLASLITAASLGKLAGVEPSAGGQCPQCPLCPDLTAAHHQANVLSSVPLDPAATSTSPLSLL